MTLANAITFNPADTSAGVLSADFLTWTANAGTSHSMVRGPSGYSSGLYYVEWTFTGGGATGNCWAGFCRQTTTVANVEANGVNAVMVGPSGTGAIGKANGSTVFTSATYPTTICAAINLTTKRAWFRVTPTDPWNNDASADPATGVNGIDISFFGTNLITPFAQGFNAASAPSWRLNAGQAAFGGVVPTGYPLGWSNAIVPAGFVNGMQPLGNYRMLFTLSAQLDDTSGIYPPVVASNALNGGHPQGRAIYFGFPDVQDTLYYGSLTLFDTQAINSGGFGTALSNWTFLLDGVNISAGLTYDGFGTASVNLPVTVGLHALLVQNIVQLSAGGTYMGTAIPNSYKTDVVTFAFTATSLVVPLAVFPADTIVTSVWGDLIGQLSPLILYPNGAAVSYTLGYRRTGAASFTLITGILAQNYAVTGLLPATSYDFELFFADASGNTSLAGTWSSTTTNIGTTLAQQFTTGIVVGDYRNGNLYLMDPDTLTDNGTQRKWLRSWRALAKPVAMPVKFNELAVDMETGADDIPVDANPQVVLRWSDDGGHTWSHEVFESAGPIGATAKRVMFRRLGSTRRLTGLDRIFELSSTDPFKVALMGAEINP